MHQSWKKYDNDESDFVALMLYVYRMGKRQHLELDAELVRQWLLWVLSAENFAFATELFKSNYAAF